MVFCVEQHTLPHDGGERSIKRCGAGNNGGRRMVSVVMIHLWMLPVMARIVLGRMPRVCGTIFEVGAVEEG